MHRITLTADKTLQKKFRIVTETKNNDNTEQILSNRGKEETKRYQEYSDEHMINFIPHFKLKRQKSKCSVNVK